MLSFSGSGKALVVRVLVSSFVLWIDVSVLVRVCQGKWLDRRTTRPKRVGGSGSETRYEASGYLDGSRPLSAVPSIVISHVP